MKYIGRQMRALGPPEWANDKDRTLRRARSMMAEYRSTMALRRAEPMRDAPLGFGKVANYRGGFFSFTLYYTKQRTSTCKDAH